MEFVAQSLNEIVATLRPLTVDWKDETARRVIDRLKAFHVKQVYSAEDVKALLDPAFDTGVLICRLFLGLSKDQFTSVLRNAMPEGGIGVTRYRSDPAVFIDTLEKVGLLEAMAEGRTACLTGVMSLLSASAAVVEVQSRVSGGDVTWKTLRKRSSERFSESNFKCDVTSVGREAGLRSAISRSLLRALRGS